MSPSYFKLRKNQVWGWLEATGTHEEQAETIQYELDRISTMLATKYKEDHFIILLARGRKNGKSLWSFRLSQGMIEGINPITPEAIGVESWNANCKIVDRVPLDVSDDLPSRTGGRMNDAFTCLEFHFGRLALPYFFGNMKMQSAQLVNKVKRAESLESVYEEWIKGSVRVEQLSTEMNSGWCQSSCHEWLRRQDEQVL